MTNLRKFDLNLLVVFEAIYTSGNVSHAARSLGLSQPTISNSLTRLRETLGDQLFIRSKHGVEPTTLAIQMIGPVREALGIIERRVANIEDFEPAQSDRKFRIALLDNLEPILIPSVIHAIQQFKSVTLEAYPLATTDIADGLNNGTLDLAVTPYMSDLEETSCREIGAAGNVVVARRDHPRIKGRMTVELFQSLGHVGLIPKLRKLTKVDEQLRQLRISRHIVYAASKLWSFPYIVANTDLIGILPGDFAELATRSYPIVIHDLPFFLPEQHAYLVWKKGRELDPGLDWLISRLGNAYVNAPLILRSGLRLR